MRSFPCDIYRRRCYVGSCNKQQISITFDRRSGLIKYTYYLRKLAKHAYAYWIYLSREWRDDKCQDFQYKNSVIGVRVHLLRRIYSNNCSKYRSLRASIHAIEV